MALRRSGGMTRKEISNHFQRHQSKDKLDAALIALPTARSRAVRATEAAGRQVRSAGGLGPLLRVISSQFGRISSQSICELIPLQITLMERALLSTF